MQASRSLAIALFIGIAILISRAEAAQARIESYPIPAIYQASDAYTLKANGMKIPVIHYEGYDYANFSMSDGSCGLQVTSLKGSIDKYAISPLKLKIQGSTHGNVLDFTLQNDAYLIVTIAGNKQLVITADPAETDKPHPSAPGVFNVTARPYSADKTGTSPATTAIQRAIDAASTAGTAHKQGIVYVPAGIYLIGNIILKSNMALYLAGGAVLRGTGNPKDYKTMFHKRYPAWVDGTWLVSTEQGSTNVKLFGRGTIDGNGITLQGNHFGDHTLMVINSSNFKLDGITFRESDSWSMLTALSHDLTLKHFKVFNLMTMGQDDGIDICDSQNVLVQHAIAIANDDSFSTKCLPTGNEITMDWHGSPQANDNITFDDCLAWTMCSGFKIGEGVSQDQTNITVMNSVVYDCGQAFGIHYKRGTGAVKNVTFNNIDVEQVRSPRKGKSAYAGKTWLAIVIDKGDNETQGDISNVKVSNITVRDVGTTPVLIWGLNENCLVKYLTFQRIYMLRSRIPATTLDEMGIKDIKFSSDISVLR
jgi:hypothetical protein